MIPVDHSKNPFTVNYGFRFYREDEPIYDENGVLQNKGYTFAPEWELYPVGRQEIMPPDVDIKLVKVPGSDFPLDMTDVLTGRPQYGTRKGEFEFKILADRSKWDAVYSSVMRKFHGKRLKIVRQEEPNYYYIGRFEVTSTKSDKYNGRIKITGTFEPYKRDVQTSTEDWLWDPFSFNDGVVYNPNNTYDGGYEQIEALKNILLPAGATKTFIFPALKMPITPNFLITGADDVSVTMLVENMKTEETQEHTLAKGNNRIAGLYLDEDGKFRLSFSHNKDTVQRLTIEFRGGSL